MSARGTITLSAGDFNPERIELQFEEAFVPGFSVEVDAGDERNDVTGVVSCSFGNYEVLVTDGFSPLDAHTEDGSG